MQSSPAADALVEGAWDHFPVLSGVRLLVVDDEVDAREMLAEVLRATGASVAMAGSAAEALELLASVRPDLIISDIGMPDVDGYSLMRQVRALPRGSGEQTPAIALTAYTRREDAERAMDAGYQAHLTKPVEPRLLCSAIARLTGR